MRNLNYLLTIILLLFISSCTKDEIKDEKFRDQFNQDYAAFLEDFNQSNQINIGEVVERKAAPAPEVWTYAEYLIWLDIIETVTDIIESSEISDFEGQKIRLLDCSSFEWTCVGAGWVSCLDPHVMTVEVGEGTGVTWSFDLGCFSYTVPKETFDGQMFDEDQASTCAAAASNLATLALKLAIEFSPPGATPSMMNFFLKGLYKEQWESWMEETGCTYGSIASCWGGNCPEEPNEPVYTDDVVAVTQDMLLGCP